jgi:hypothetical protein
MENIFSPVNITPKHPPFSLLSPRREVFSTIESAMLTGRRFRVPIIYYR